MNKSLVCLTIAALVALPLVQPAAAHADVADTDVLAGLPLTGRVVSPDGKPLPGVPVYVLLKSPVTAMDPRTQQLSQSTALSSQTVITDPKGNYAASGIKPGDTVSLFVSKPGYRLVGGGSISSAPNGYVAADLVVAPPTEILAGQVTDLSGQAVGSVAVIAPSSNVTLQGTSDASGHFVLEGLPVGDTDVFAISKMLYGRSTVKTGATGFVVKVSPVALPSSADIASGTTLLNQLATETSGSSYPAYETIGSELAPYDLDGAVKIATSAGTPSDSAVLALVLAATKGDVAKDAPAVQTLLDQMQDPGQKALGAAYYGLELSRRGLDDLARTFYEKAKPWAQQSPVQRYGGFERIAVAALAGRLKDRDAEKMVDDTIHAVFDGAKAANGNNAQGIQDVMIATLTRYAAIVAPGGANLVQRVINQLPETTGGYPVTRPQVLPLMQAAEALAPYDANGAVSLLAKVSPEDAGTPIFGEAASAVVEQLVKTDPAAAMSLALRVIDQDHKPVALAFAATGQPASTAPAAWSAALSAALSSTQKPALSGWVCALASQSNPTLAASLATDALNKLINQLGMPGGLSAFMFYYAPVDAGQARLIAEKEYALATLSARASDDTSPALPSILAMCAIDDARAVEMANALDGPTKPIALRKIAQYVMLPPDVKHTLRFDRWMIPDTWLPGTPVGM